MNKILTLLLMLAVHQIGDARERINFDNGWKFLLADSAEMAQADYNDSHWRSLSLPHDWAVEGDFYAGNPSGAGGGALPGGIGWYRKTLNVSGVNVNKTFIEFDGVYMNSTVYVNGKQVGYRPYGYSSFEYDITDFLKEGNNVIAVRVDNSDQPNSRWYSGCGIYRHVWLTRTEQTHVAHWGTYVTATPAKNGNKADFNVEVEVVNPQKGMTVTNILLNASGKELARKNASAKGGVKDNLCTMQSKLSINNPTL